MAVYRGIIEVWEQTRQLADDDELTADIDELKRHLSSMTKAWVQSGHAGKTATRYKPPSQRGRIRKSA